MAKYSFMFFVPEGLNTPKQHLIKADFSLTCLMVWALVGSVLFLLLKILLNLPDSHILIATFLTDHVYLEVRKVGDPQYLAWPG